MTIPGEIKTSPPAPLSYRRDFAKLMAGEAISYIGDQIALVAILLLVFQQTKNGAALGFAVIFLQAAPLLIFGSIGGILADRFPRRQLMIAMDLLRAIVSVLLLWSSNLIAIYALLFFLGVGRAVFSPALRALMPQIIPTEHLARSNAMFSTIFNASLFVGPAIGGVILAAWGTEWAFILNAISFLISGLCIWWIPAPPSTQGAARKSKGGISPKEILHGLGIVWQMPKTRGVTLSLIAVVLAGGLLNIAAVGMAEIVFHAGSTGYGILTAGAGLGILAGGLYISLGPKLNPIDPWLARGIGIMALAITAVALAPTLFIATFALAFEGLGNAFQNTSNTTVLQITVPGDQQGRAFGGLFTFASIANIPSLALGGVLLTLISVRLIYAGAAVLMIGATIVAWVSVASPLKARKS